MLIVSMYISQERIKQEDRHLLPCELVYRSPSHQACFLIADYDGVYKQHCHSTRFTYILGSRVGAVVRAQWWERSPSTNVSWVRFSDSASHVGWVCWVSTQKLTFNLIWFDTFDLFDLIIWYDLFGLQSFQLVEHLCSARMNSDLNKVIINIIIIIIIINYYFPAVLPLFCRSIFNRAAMGRARFIICPWFFF